MDRDTLDRLIAELDVLVPKDGALIRVGGADVVDQQDPLLVGNRTGYLRLGIELLKVADAQATAHNPARVQVDLRYLLDTTANEGPLSTFERREAIRPWSEEQEPPRTGAVGLVIPVMALIALVLLLVGLYDTATWLWRMLAR